jgi:hypothetical protein
VLIRQGREFAFGTLVGLVIGYRFARELDAGSEARSLASAAWWMLGLALVCWLMLNAVRAALTRRAGGRAPRARSVLSP